MCNSVDKRHIRRYAGIRVVYPFETCLARNPDRVNVESQRTERIDGNMPAVFFQAQVGLRYPSGVGRFIPC